MRFDTVVIGGGLAGLSAGIKLAESGQKVAIVSSGQSTLHFFSGTLELLGSADGENETTRPFDGMELLASGHPYSKIGRDNIAELADEAVVFLNDCGLRFNGGGNVNHYHITPFGKLKTGWITMGDFLTTDSAETFPYKKVGLVNVAGYLDFYPQYIALTLEKLGVKCETFSVISPQLQKLRSSSTEMRATNMARVMTPETVGLIAESLNAADAGIEAFFLPAIFGLTDTEALDDLRRQVDRPVWFIPTMPTSAPGVRMQIALRNRFQSLGGTYLLGDSVTGGEIEGERLLSVKTANLGSDSLRADNFILATGSFLSHGIKATPDQVYEPVLGLDVDSLPEREEWYRDDFYSDQPYMNFGVHTDSEFRLSKSGHVFSNFYGAGSVLSGSNAIVNGCGGGVALFTGLHVAKKILKKD